MDNIRFALLCALGVLGFFIYQAWQDDYATVSQPVAEAPAEPRPQPSGGTDVPSLASAPEADEPARADADAQPTPGAAATPVLEIGDTIHVVTDKLDVIIDTHGSDLRKVALRDVPVSSEKPDSSLRLINDTAPNFFIAQSGLVGEPAPDHGTVYQSPRDEYRLTEGEKTLQVPLTWSDGRGHQVTKVYTFTRGSYRIGLRHEVDNDSDTPWTLSQYVRFWRTPYQIAQGVPFASPFFGVGWYEAIPGEEAGYRYETRGHEELAEVPVSTTQRGGWIAMVQHYFIGAAVPPADTKVRYYAQTKDVPGTAMAGFTAGFISAKKTIDPGHQADLTATLFVGPKLQDQLDAVAPGLNLTVDYGWLTVLAKPIFWILEKLHTIVGNWGVAIILLTMLIKLLFFKLSEKQYRAMARMRKFAPRMQQLKEQYGDDKQKLQSKMMDLYKKEGFNPLAGCWPMLVQMPVFIALYWVLQGSVELRLASFLWIADLSAPDPYYILPLVFGVTMFLQQRLQTNMTMDPIQQRMMQIMPVGMAVFFAFFPAGLVLYWCTNNILSIGQQWYIYRKLDAEGLGHSASAK